MSSKATDLMFIYSFTKLAKTSVAKLKFSDFFEDAKQAVISDSQNNASEEYCKLKAEGYIFCTFIEHRLELALLVKPTKEVAEKFNQAVGEPIDSVVINKISGLVSFKSAGSNKASFAFERIAAKIDLDELKKETEAAQVYGSLRTEELLKKFHSLQNQRFNSPLKKEKQLKYYAQMVWISAGYALKDFDLVSRANNGDCDQFYRNEHNYKFLRENLGIKTTL